MSSTPNPSAHEELDWPSIRSLSTMSLSLLRSFFPGEVRISVIVDQAKGDNCFMFGSHTVIEAAQAVLKCSDAEVAAARTAPRRDDSGGK